MYQYIRMYQSLTFLCGIALIMTFAGCPGNTPGTNTATTNYNAMPVPGDFFNAQNQQLDVTDGWLIRVGDEVRYVDRLSTYDGFSEKLNELAEPQSYTIPDSLLTAYTDGEQVITVYDGLLFNVFKSSFQYPGNQDYSIQIARIEDTKLFFTYKGDVYYFPKTDYLTKQGSQQVLNSGDITDIALSPDKKWLVYGRRTFETDKDAGLWKVSVENGGDGPAGKPLQLVPPSGDVFAAHAPAWSPDGKNIAFVHAWEGGALGFVGADGKNLRTNIGAAWKPVFWVSNDAVIYDTGGPEDTTAEPGIYRCNITGQPERVVSGLICSYDVIDGKLAVLTAEGQANPDESATTLRLRIYDNLAGELHEIWNATVDGSWGECMWAPSGESVAVFAMPVDAEDMNLLYTGALEDNELQLRREDVNCIIGRFWGKGTGADQFARPVE